jgi:hypothetical protein
VIFIHLRGRARHLPVDDLSDGLPDCGSRVVAEPIKPVIAAGELAEVVPGRSVPRVGRELAREAAVGVDLPHASDRLARDVAVGVADQGAVDLGD